MKTSSDLFDESRKQLADHAANSLQTPLLESELFDLWVTATWSCRLEIIRLEKLLVFQECARLNDAKMMNATISRLGKQIQAIQ